MTDEDYGSQYLTIRMVLFLFLFLYKKELGSLKPKQHIIKILSVPAEIIRKYKAQSFGVCLKVM